MDTIAIGLPGETEPVTDATEALASIKAEAELVPDGTVCRRCTRRDRPDGLRFRAAIAAACTWRRTARRYPRQSRSPAQSTLATSEPPPNRQQTPPPDAMSELAALKAGPKTFF